MSKPKRKSLNSMLQTVSPPKKRGPKKLEITTTKITGDERPTELERKIFVRRLVTAYLAHDMNMLAAYRHVKPHVSESTAATEGYKQMMLPDVRAELYRQLKGVIAAMDNEEDFVKAHWKGMAMSNIFDYLKIDKTGVIKEVNLDPETLSLEQQLNVREIKIDAELMKVSNIKLVDRQSAVDSIAKANKMFSELQSEDMAGVGKAVMEMLNSAAKRRGRVIDNDTGEDV